MQISTPSFDTAAPAAVVFNYAESVDRPEPAKLGKVLHIINGEHFSGAERVQQLLGKQLDQFGFDATFACIKPGKFPEECQLRKHQICEFPMRNRLDRAVAKAIAHKVQTEHFDLLHAHTPRSAMVTAAVARRTGLPWIYHVHSPTARDSTRGIVNRLNNLVERHAIRSCTRLLTVSRSLRREMLRCGVPRSRLSVVPNGVPAFEPIDTQSRLNATSWKLGIVALMRPRKGIEMALEAMHRLPADAPTTTLDLIGGFETPEYQHAIEERVRRYGLESRVRMLGFCSDMQQQVRRLDALLLPSLFGEGMPMVVLEAMSAAVPVIATRVEGTPEVIRHGVEGLLAEPRNPDDLAKAITEMTCDREQWQQLSLNALNRHRTTYTDSHMAGRVAKAYCKVLGLAAVHNPPQASYA